jgi:hypothetical protein
MTQPVDDWVVPGAPPAADDWVVPGAPQARAPASGWDRFTTGLGDIFRGAEQFSANLRGDGGEPALIQRMRADPRFAGAVGDIPMETATQANTRMAEREQAYQASRGPNPGTDWLRIGGQAVAGLPIGLGAAPVTLPGAIGAGVVQGAVQGALQPVPEGDYTAGAVQNAVVDGLAGGAGGAVAQGVGRVLQGRQAPSVRPEVGTLADAGVRLTPGQIAGGYTQRIEDTLGSVPLLGAQVRGAQRDGVESFNRAVANQVLAPLGQQVDAAAPVGRELVDGVYDRISAVYNSALPRVQPFGPDSQFMGDLRRVGGQFLTPESRAQFDGFLQNNILSRAGGGRIDGEAFKTIEEELGRAFRAYRASGSPQDREFADAALGVQRAFRDLLARSNPAVAPEIRAANESFARYIRLERAAGGQAATEGVFTPAQFSGAVRGADSSARRGAYARGDALMQDLSDAGRAVMPRTVPDSGTPERAALIALLAGGPSVAAGVSPGTLAAGLAAAGAYSNPGRRMVQAALLGRRNPMVAGAGRNLVPLGAPGAASYFLAPPGPSGTN